MYIKNKSKCNFYFQKSELKTIKDKFDLKITSGPCVATLDKILNLLNVQRQAYHGKSFVGNHVHKIIKDSRFISSISIALWLIEFSDFQEYFNNRR